MHKGRRAGAGRAPAPREIAEAVRTVCVETVVNAYEEAGIRGLCGEGRWEYAVDALRTLDLTPVLARIAGVRP